MRLKTFRIAIAAAALCLGAVGAPPPSSPYSSLNHVRESRETFDSVSSRETFPVHRQHRSAFEARASKGGSVDVADGDVGGPNTSASASTDEKSKANVESGPWTNRDVSSHPPRLIRRSLGEAFGMISQDIGHDMAERAFGDAYDLASQGFPERSLPQLLDLQNVLFEHYYAMNQENALAASRARAIISMLTQRIRKLQGRLDRARQEGSAQIDSVNAVRGRGGHPQKRSLARRIDDIGDPDSKREAGDHTQVVQRSIDRDIAQAMASVQPAENEAGLAQVHTLRAFDEVQSLADRKFRGLGLLQLRRIRDDLDEHYHELDVHNDGAMRRADVIRAKLNQRIDELGAKKRPTYGADQSSSKRPHQGQGRWPDVEVQRRSLDTAHTKRDLIGTEPVAEIVESLRDPGTNLHVLLNRILATPGRPDLDLANMRAVRDAVDLAIPQFETSPHILERLQEVRTRLHRWILELTAVEMESRAAGSGGRQLVPSMLRGRRRAPSAMSPSNSDAQPAELGRRHEKRATSLDEIALIEERIDFHNDLMGTLGEIEAHLATVRLMEALNIPVVRVRRELLEIWNADLDRWHAEAGAYPLPARNSEDGLRLRQAQEHVQAWIREHTAAPR